MKSVKTLIATSIVSTVILAASATTTAADKTAVKITPDIASVDVMHDGKKTTIMRNQDEKNTVNPSFAKTSRKCPPFCIQPAVLAPGVETIAEVEMLDYLSKINAGDDSILVIDSRTPDWVKKGTIPGSVNIPFTVFERTADDPELVEVLERLGAKQRDDVSVVMRSLEKVGLFNGHEKTDRWDFSDARQLLLWCNGPWCGQSPRAIHALVALGYPAEKLYYYRGGMQMWQSLGLSTVLPSDISSYASK